MGTSAATITGVQATTQDLSFGFRPNEPLPFNGLIDDVRIYNEALQPPSVTLWQIGIFDNAQTEFLSGNLDTSFVCDSLVPGGSGAVGDFIVGVTPTGKFPGVIRSSNASTSDAGYTKSCNSTTIRFTVPEGISYNDVVLNYSRMGGEKDAIYFDGTFVGFAGPL